MLGMHVQLVDHMVVSVPAALSNTDDLAVHLGHDEQALARGRGDVRIVPPPADLVIRSIHADQRRVVRPNVRRAESTDSRDIVVLSISNN